MAGRAATPDTGAGCPPPASGRACCGGDVDRRLSSLLRLYLVDRAQLAAGPNPIGGFSGGLFPLPLRETDRSRAMRPRGLHCAADDLARVDILVGQVARVAGWHRAAPHQPDNHHGSGQE